MINNRIVFIILILLIGVFALTPVGVIDIKWFNNSDKLKHAIAFLILSYFFYKSFDVKYKFFMLIFIAGIIELLQIFTNREVSFFDFLASCIGILIFLIIRFLFIYKKYK